MLMLLGGEAMFFGGLVIAFLQLRLGAAVWPPPGQPRLPIGLTAVNTLVLLASSWTLVWALRAIRADDRTRLVRWLAWTWGSAPFPGHSGRRVDAARALRAPGASASMAPRSTLIGVHGVSRARRGRLAAGAWLARRGWFTHDRHVALECCAIYWHFVVALWPVLYVLVYLV
jgi:heme/copper-type cytochrome/quinol oxidase subunit 3